MDNSEFASNNINTISSIKYAEVAQLSTPGATCDTFKVRIYGKLHFLKRPHNIHDTRLQDAFIKEFELGFNLDHPGIVKYAHFDNDTFGIFSEWIEGSTLTQFISENPNYFKSTKNIDRFVAQLTDAIQYLHSRQIIHLDLKPDNLMITDIDKSVKIIDLGFALNDCFDSTPGRTPRFAAPEQLSSDAKVDCRTDIYTIGRIIEYIFECTEIKIPSRYVRLISSCTAPDPADRPYSIAQVQELLTPKHRLTTILSIVFAILFAIAIGGIITYNNLSNTQAIESNETISVDSSIIEVEQSNRPIKTITTANDHSTPTSPTTTAPTPDSPNELSPDEKLYKAEEDMGMFVAIKGYYELKKEWYDRQYHLFDSLRTEYLKTDTSQRLGIRLNFALRDFIERNKETIAKKYPDIDAKTIALTGHDIERVIVYLCYSDSRLYTDTDFISQIFIDCAHKKAQLLSSK